MTAANLTGGYADHYRAALQALKTHGFTAEHPIRANEISLGVTVALGEELPTNDYLRLAERWVNTRRELQVAA